MRLIDADNIEFSCQYEGECMADKESCKICDDYVCTFREVQSLQTAYDVNKVVKQVEKDKFIDCETVLSDVHQGYNAGLSRAVMVVKAGGENDD